MLKIVRCYTSVSKGSCQFISVGLKIFVANLLVKRHLYTDPSFLCNCLFLLDRSKKKKPAGDMFIILIILLLFVCIPGFSSSASSRTDVTHTNRIPRLGEVCSTVHTELYHSTNAVPATGGRCTQNKSC